jgi:polysaccharide export outer membrane protein
MKPRILYALLVSFTFPTAFAEAGFAQIDMHQSIASQGGAIASRIRPAPAAATRNSNLAQVPADFALLKLAPGFLLSLNVLDDSDFAGTFRIDEQGNIALPVLGTLHVTGKTVSEARTQIRQELLENKILQDPQVDLSILEYSVPEVTIIGEVASPGRYPLLASRKLVDVLALAGGTTITAGNEIQITRGNSTSEPVLVHYSKATNPRAVEDAIVNPGDTVQVKRAGIVYVLGAVARPGGYVMQEDGTLNVLQAVSLANGTTIAASIGTIHLLRRNADGSEVDIALPLRKMQQGQSADVQLHATDVLFVPTSKVKSTLTYSEGILTAATSASIYAAVVY